MEKPILLENYFKFIQICQRDFLKRSFIGSVSQPQRILMDNYCLVGRLVILLWLCLVFVALAEATR